MGKFLAGFGFVPYEPTRSPVSSKNRSVQAGIRYRMYGGLKFYDRKEVKDILAYLRVLVNPADDISVRRACQMFPNALWVIRR